jgi:hypothetical protein
MEINSHILKLNGKAELPKEIEIAKNYHIALDGSIESFSVHNNNNGTFDKIYTFKPVHIELLTELGETLKLKDPRKNSTKIRNLLYFKWKELNEPIDFEEYYTKFTNTVLSNMDALIAKSK